MVEIGNEDWNGDWGCAYPTYKRLLHEFTGAGSIGSVFQLFYKICSTARFRLRVHILRFETET
jgi:hypothetical protein